MNDIRRQLGMGQGTMADKLRTHLDPFEVLPLPPVVEKTPDLSPFDRYVADLQKRGAP